MNKSQKKPKVLANGNVLGIKELLEAEGYDVAIPDKEGDDDHIVQAKANAENRVVVTCDHDWKNKDSLNATRKTGYVLIATHPKKRSIEEKAAMALSALRERTKELKNKQGIVVRFNMARNVITTVALPAWREGKDGFRPPGKTGTRPDKRTHPVIPIRQEEPA